MQCASAMPAPPPVATPTEFMPQPRNSPRVSAVSPSRKEPSGVKLSGPLSSIFTPAVSSAGSRCSAFLIIGSKWSQSSGSNWKAKSSPSRSGSMGLACGSKQPMSSPPESSRM